MEPGKARPRNGQAANGKPINLKLLSEKLGLSQATVSMALSDTAGKSGISAKTKQRVKRAAEEYGYRPNYFARYLSMGRSYTVAIMVPEIGDGYYSTAIAGIEEQLALEEYFYFVSSHRWNPKLIAELPEVFLARGAEGLIVINTAIDQVPRVPVVCIGGQGEGCQFTTIRTDENHGTWLALSHLASLGHKKIAFFKGDKESTATERRWHGILSAASKLNIEVNPDLVLQLKSRTQMLSPTDAREGYSSTEALLLHGIPFTALFAYNDISAIGAIHALQNAGIRVPEDVSVMGYGGIPSGELERPALTTIHEGVRKIGAVAAETLLRRIANPELEPVDILVKPKLLLRQSTALAKCKARSIKSVKKARVGKKNRIVPTITS